MTDVERDFLAYDGRRALAERSGSSILVGVPTPYDLEPTNDDSTNAGATGVSGHLTFSSGTTSSARYQSILV